MKRLFIICLLAISTSCSNNPESYIEHISGYWEIESVELADGTNRSYTYNETIDYFNITDSLIGIRKKLKPNFDGKFNTSKDVETLKFAIEQDSLHIYCSTPFAKWKETVLFANEEKLKIINQNKNVYLYKRYTPLNIN